MYVLITFDTLHHDAPLMTFTSLLAAMTWAERNLKAGLWRKIEEVYPQVRDVCLD